MGIGVEVEEWAGEIWHKFITRRADPGFPEAQVELEDMLGAPVDVVTPGDLPARIRAQVIAEARPL